MWLSPDNILYEFNYIVSQFEHEGPDHLVMRPFQNGFASLQDQEAWERVENGDLEEDTIQQLDDFFNGAEIGSVNPDNIPRIWEVFSELRIIGDDIESTYLQEVGNMDEPLSLLIEAALDNELTPSNRELLRYLISKD
jgi:hypothetical protein